LRNEGWNSISVPSTSHPDNQKVCRRGWIRLCGIAPS